MKNKFYIGYELNGEIKPISYLSSNFEQLDTDFMSVIRFTSSYNNEQELINVLNSSPGDHVPEGAKLCYVMSRRVNGELGFYKALNSDMICYSSSIDFQEPEDQLNEIISNIYDDNFIIKLYAVVLKALSIDSTIYKRLGNVDDTELVEYYLKNKDQFTNIKSIILSDMDILYNKIRYANSLGIENYINDKDNESEEIISLITNIYKNLTIKVKRERQPNGRYTYKYCHEINGEYLRDSKCLGYIAVLLTEFNYMKYTELTESYMEEIAPVVNKEVNDLVFDMDEDDMHDEEFLESDDFARIGDDPEEANYKFRK